MALSYLAHMMQSHVQSTPLVFLPNPLCSLTGVGGTLHCPVCLQMEKQKLREIGDLSTFTWPVSGLLTTCRGPRGVLGTLSFSSLKPGAQLKCCQKPDGCSGCPGLGDRGGEGPLKVCCPAAAHGGMPPGTWPRISKKLETWICVKCPDF